LFTASTVSIALLMADDRTTKILDTALWRFALQGVPATKTAEIARLAGVGVGTLFRTFPTKMALLQATYEHAIVQLTAPLQTGEGEAKRQEYLHQYLERWWHLTAQAALAYPEAFDVWRLVRTMPRPAAPLASLLGPFAALAAPVEEALARSPWHAQKGVPLSVLLASLAAQWTAAVDLVLSDGACRAQTALGKQVLTQAYAGWWQSLGLSKSLATAPPAAASKPRPQPVPEITIWAQAFLNVFAPLASTPLPSGPTTQSSGRSSKGLFLKAKDEPTG
jgi:AcrR family transcriptional regulator